VSNATIRRDMTAISSVLGHCVDEDWIEENPARMMDRSRSRSARTKIILPRDRKHRASFAVGSRFMDMAELSLETGMRQEESRQTGAWDRIDRARMSATSKRPRTATVREVPLTRSALAIIDRQPRTSVLPLCSGGAMASAS
jgi:integrase/recombinase XerD